VYHEFGHVWRRNHKTGSDDKCSPSMHSHDEGACPVKAFSEGFSIFFSCEMGVTLGYYKKNRLYDSNNNTLYGNHCTMQDSRVMTYFLENGPTYPLNYINTYSKYAAVMLRVLTIPNLYKFTANYKKHDVNTYTDPFENVIHSTCPASPSLTFHEVLKVFLAHPNKQRPSKFQVSEKKGIWYFYNRVEDIHGIDKKFIPMVKVLVSDENFDPEDYCDPKTNQIHEKDVLLNKKPIK